MLPSTARFSRPQLSEFLANKGIFVVFNRLGTLKYLPSDHLRLSVVTSSKAEKRAVVRNKLRRRIYATIGLQKPQIQGIVYVSKQSYGFTYDEIKTLTIDLLAKTQKNTTAAAK